MGIRDLAAKLLGKVVGNRYISRDAYYSGLNAFASELLRDHLLRWKFPKSVWYKDKEFLTKIRRDPKIAKCVNAARIFVSTQPYYFENSNEAAINLAEDMFKKMPLHGKLGGNGLFWHLSEGLPNGVCFVRLYGGFTWINGKKTWIPRYCKQFDFRNWHQEHDNPSDRNWQWMIREYYETRGRARSLTEEEAEMFIIGVHDDVQDLEGAGLGWYETIYPSWRIGTDCTKWLAKSSERGIEDSIFATYDPRRGSADMISRSQVETTLDTFLKEFTKKRAGNFFGSNVPLKIDRFSLNSAAHAAVREFRDEIYKDINDFILGSSQTMTGDGQAQNTRRAAKMGESMLFAYTGINNYYIQDMIKRYVMPLLYKYNPAQWWERDVKRVEDMPDYVHGPKEQQSPEETRKNLATARSIGIDLSDLDGEKTTKALRIHNLFRAGAEIKITESPEMEGGSPFDKRQFEKKGDTANPGMTDDNPSESPVVENERE